MSRDIREQNQWPTRRLGEVLIRHNEVIHPGERTGQATFVGLEHIEPNSGRCIGSLTINLGSLTGRKPTFRRGQIVYGYLRPYLNKVWVAEFDGFSSVDQFAFDVRPEMADTKFVAAFMRSETFLRRSSIVTTTGQLPRIGTDQIAAVPIELPPVEVQRRIAASVAERLVVAEAAIRAATDRLVVAKALVTAYLRSAFESSDREWATARLGDLCELLPSKSISTKGDTDVTAVTTGCLSETGFLATGLKAARMRRADVTDCLVKAGEVLVARSNTPELVGRASLYRGVSAGVVASDLTIRLWPRTSIGGDYIAAFLSYLYQTGHWRQRAGGASGTMKKITRAQLLSQPLKVPADPLVADSIVADLSTRLKGADALVSRCRDELSQLELLPAALLRTAFCAGT